MSARVDGAEAGEVRRDPPRMSSSCVFCREKEAKYTCPKCGKGYCGTECYKSRGHLECTEDFYRKCVEEEIRLRDAENRENKEGKRKMIETLKRVNDYQQEEEDEDDLDSDDDQDEEDLALRLGDVDLDDAEGIWERLTPGERRDFERRVRNGDIEKVVPEFSPWWEHREEEKLVQEIGEDDGDGDEFKSRCPDVVPDEDIPSLSSLTKAVPSPSVKFSLLNVLYAYAYGARYFSGDHSSCCLEFVDLCLTLSGSLSKGHNFETADEALEAAATNVNVHNRLAVSPEMTRGAKRDVYNIVRGPNRRESSFYILCALSDMKAVFEKCCKEGKKSNRDRGQHQRPLWKQDASFTEEVDLKTAKRSVKKLEFYLSWTKDHGREYELVR